MTYHTEYSVNAREIVVTLHRLGNSDEENIAYSVQMQFFFPPHLFDLKLFGPQMQTLEIQTEKATCYLA